LVAARSIQGRYLLNLPRFKEVVSVFVHFRAPTNRSFDGSSLNDSDYILLKEF
jgi:hypothetical protein